MKNNSGSWFNVEELALLENVLLLVLYSLMAYIMVSAVGGVDLVNYKEISQLSFNEWDGYFYKEFFSWAIIKLSYSVSDFIGLEQPVIVLTLFLFGLMRLLTAGVKLDVKYLPLVLFAPLSILLAFNILRQYVAIFMLFLSILMLLHGKVAQFVLLAVMAVFSHNSIIFILMVVLFSYWLNLRSALFMVLGMQIAIFLLNKMFGLGLYESVKYNDDGSTAPLVKVVLHFVYVLFLYIAFKLSFGIDRNGTERFLSKLGMGLLLFSILNVLFPWPFWVTNRFLIYVAFIYLALLLIRCNFWKVNELRYRFMLAGLFFVNAGAISVHKGALQMLAFSHSG